MRRRRVFAPLAATAGALVATAAVALTGPTATAATAVPAIPGLAGLQVSGATDLGVAPAAARDVTLVLNQRDPAGLAARLAANAAPLSTADWMATYAPTTQAVDTVRAWAAAHGLTVVEVPANRAYVRVAGSQDAVAAALGVAFHAFRAPDGTSYVASVGTAALPADVTAVTRSVLGLSTLGHASTPHASPSATLSFPTSYGPQDFWSLYDAPAGQTGGGQTVAVITEGDVSQAKSDLVTFEQRYGLPQVPWNQVQVGTPSTDTSGADEWDLDTQYSTGFAPGVSGLTVYNGPSLGNADILSTINRWVADNSNRQASFSAGECELLAYASGLTSGLDTVLAQAVAQGQTLFTSSGDTGSFCAALVGVNGVPAGLPGVSYPASSPYAIGVGGTTVLGSGPTEIAWYAGGGGTSLLEPTPAWQANAGGSFTGVRRGVPDVSLDADPNSGYQVIVAGQQQVIGGTSASAPSWQGIWARAQAAHGGALGFAGPVLYGTVPASAFHDVIVGTQGIFVATPGWDYTTGRGTPDIAAVVAGS